MRTKVKRLKLWNLWETWVIVAALAAALVGSALFYQTLRGEGYQAAQQAEEDMSEIIANKRESIWDYRTDVEGAEQQTGPIIPQMEQSRIRYCADYRQAADTIRIDPVASADYRKITDLCSYHVYAGQGGFGFCYPANLYAEVQEEHYEEEFCQGDIITFSSSDSSLLRVERKVYLRTVFNTSEYAVSSGIIDSLEQTYGLTIYDWDSDTFYGSWHFMDWKGYGTDTGVMASGVACYNTDGVYYSMTVICPNSTVVEERTYQEFYMLSMRMLCQFYRDNYATMGWEEYSKVA